MGLLWFIPFGVAGAKSSIELTYIIAFFAHQGSQAVIGDFPLLCAHLAVSHRNSSSRDLWRDHIPGQVRVWVALVRQFGAWLWTRVCPACLFFSLICVFEREKVKAHGAYCSRASPLLHSG